MKWIEDNLSWELKFYKADQNKRCFKQKITNNKHTNVAKQNFWKRVANECNWENGPLVTSWAFLKEWTALPTVDGSEIRRAPVDMVNIPFFTTGFKNIQTVGSLGFLNHQQWAIFDLFFVTRTYSFSNPVPITENRHLHNWYIQGGRGGLETTKMCR